MNKLTTVEEIETMLSSDECASRIGRHLGSNLGMRFLKLEDRWQTCWGTKTDAGLARIIFSQMIVSGESFARDAEIAANSAD